MRQMLLACLAVCIVFPKKKNIKKSQIKGINLKRAQKRNETRVAKKKTEIPLKIQKQQQQNIEPISTTQYRT